MFEEGEKHIEHLVSAIILLILILGCFFVLRPFISALLWAVILSFSTWPVYKWWTHILKGRKTLAATVMTLLLAGIFIVPVLVIGLSFTDEAMNFITRIRQTFQTGLPALPEWVARLPFIGADISRRWQEWTADKTQFEQFIDPYLKQVRTYIFTAAPVVAQALFQILLSIIVCFFFYRDGEETAQSLKNFLKKVAGERSERLIKVAADTTKSVVYGIIGTAAVQGLLQTIGFLIAGVPGALLFGFITFFLSLIPMGPPLVWIPAMIWLFYKGSVAWGIFMGIWGMFVVSGVDNIVKPYLISRGGNLPFILILLGVLGGVIAFGFIGVFLGPTLLALGFSLVSEWTSRKDTAQAEETTK
jgi:predicted PurR-regulated permease PerM